MSGVRKLLANSGVVGVLRTGIGATANGAYEGCQGILNIAVILHEVLYKARCVRAQAKEVVHDQNLSVCTRAGADTNDWNFYLARDVRRQGCRDALQKKNAGSRILNFNGIGED